jgi:hypothetical protein
MKVAWTRHQLRTNYQEVVLCPHDVARPWVKAPVILHRGRRLWQPGGSIRECCIARGKGLAIAAWWWEVEQRFKDLLTVGLPDAHVTEVLRWQLDVIEEELEEVVPKPTQSERQHYIWYREDLGLERKLKDPPGFKDLGLKWPCTRAELDARWRELVRINHPDRKKGDPTDFLNMSRAYKTAKAAFERQL